jgi:hypothetical protein
MMRARIGAQGLTVVAILGGFFLGSKGPSNSNVAESQPTTSNK